LTDKLIANRTEIVDAIGYEFQFSPATVSLADLADWVAVEGKCCQFFDFHILERRGGLLCLRLTGAEGVKPFIRSPGVCEITRQGEKQLRARDSGRGLDPFRCACKMQSAHPALDRPVGVRVFVLSRSPTFLFLTSLRVIAVVCVQLKAVVGNAPLYVVFYYLTRPCIRR
jgi:hypothetical protein